MGEVLPPPAEAVRLESDQPQLRAAAEQILRAAGVRISEDAGAPSMRVRENAREEVEAVGADGAPNFYAVRYQLAYQLGENPERVVSESRIVAHQESRYLAERKRRRAVISDLRRRALGEMIYRLRKRPPAPAPAPTPAETIPDSPEAGSGKP